MSGKSFKVSCTCGVTSEQKRKYFLSTRFTEKKGACSLITLHRALAQMRTIKQLRLGKEEREGIFLNNYNFDSLVVTELIDSSLNWINITKNCLLKRSP